VPVVVRECQPPIQPKNLIAETPLESQDDVDAHEPLTISDISPRKVVAQDLNEAQHDGLSPMRSSKKRVSIMTTSCNEQPRKKGKRDDAASSTAALQPSLGRNVNVTSCSSSLGSGHGNGKTRTIREPRQGPHVLKGKSRNYVSGSSKRWLSTSERTGKSESEAVGRRFFRLRQGVASGPLPNSVRNVLIFASVMLTSPCLIDLASVLSAEHEVAPCTSHQTY
jgi:hypothetical protein